MTRSRNARLICALFLSAGAFALAPACNKPAADGDAQLDNQDDGHGLHTVQNQRLAFIMSELRGLDLDGYMKNAADVKHDRRLADAARYAASLAADARMMPALFKTETYSQESRRVFDQMAGRLQIQCLELRDAAVGNDSTRARAKLDQVIRTCNECHSSFRGPSMAWVSDDDVPY